MNTEVILVALLSWDICNHLPNIMRGLGPVLSPLQTLTAKIRYHIYLSSDLKEQFDFDGVFTVLLVEHTIFGIFYNFTIFLIIVIYDFNVITLV